MPSRPVSSLMPDLITHLTLTSGTTAPEDFRHWMRAPDKTGMATADGVLRIGSQTVCGVFKEDQTVPAWSMPTGRAASGRAWQSCRRLSFSSSPAACFRKAITDCRLRLPTLQCSRGVTEGDRNEPEGTYPDDDMLALEAALQSAIKYENYVQAAIIRDKMRRLQSDEVASVLSANAKFYDAFAKGDVASMKRVWLNADNVYCVHPGNDCISGYELVMASWELLLGAPLRFELQNLEVHVKGPIGYVTCKEVVRTTGSSWGLQVATNIFEKKDGEWFICAHHASHI